MATIHDIFAPKASDRYIVLGEKNQELPERLKVISYNVKESSTGRQYVELNCVDDDDIKMKVSVFQRDVKQCVAQWGSDPKNWGYLQFVMNMTNNRYYLAPHPDQNVEMVDVK